MALTISTRSYVLAHGKEPRGRGYWAFFFDGENDINNAFWHNGLYSEALKYARAYAFTKGYTSIDVGS